LGKEVRKFMTENDKVFVVELNRDGQLHQMITLDSPDTASKMVMCAHLDGLPLTAKWIIDQVKSNLGGG
jgi:2-oxoglutarate ferredoxin oxidoreductase subunit alpha